MRLPRRVATNRRQHRRQVTGGAEREAAGLPALLARLADQADEVVAGLARICDEARAWQMAAQRRSPEMIEREQLEAELLESLIERGEALRSEAESLASVLARASAGLGARREPALEAAEALAVVTVAEGGGPTSSTKAPRASRMQAPARDRASRPSSRGAPRRRERLQASEGARMIVMQMAASGSGPKEIEERLRRDFGMTEAATVVDEVLGGG
jgi:hypothetical protein